MKKTTLLFAMALGAAFTPAMDVAASPAAPAAMMAIDPAAILAEVDKRAAAFDDQSYTATMQIYKEGALKKTLVFFAVMKGLDKQFIQFVAPGDVAGMKVLLEGGDANNLYLYVPEFKKVRRVAAHMQNQGFLGSELNLSDMIVEMAPYYDATIAKSEGSLTELVLTTKAGKETAYPKIALTIDGSKGGVTQLVYFDGSGAEVRKQQRDEWVKIDGKLVPTKISMTNLKTKDVTVITMSEIKVNQNVGDDLFSRRNLLRE
jgi:outer membrane lipoprotein-sorting protein